ncbi:MAG TPA: SDR family oxidoreductase [Candidatus Elarobacter sp.]|nr:SDR family oxidoreductase [Candidatus Elarobacter sp.]
MSAKSDVALVTGAGSGIGRAVASALGRAGFSLVLAGRRAEQLEIVAAAIREGDGNALAVPTDVTDPAAVAALFAATKSAFGRLDLLFNNAGVNPPPTPIEDLSVEAWRATVDTNLSGMFYCTREAVRLMKAQHPQGGRIINNGSLAAYAPRPNTIAYTATKHAVSGLTRSTSLDGRRYNIACGQIDIGNAATEMTAAYASGAPQAAGTVVAEPRLDLDHIAQGVLYMANLPLDANVLFMTVMATNMPFVGRG